MVPLGDVATIERSGVDPTVLDRDTPYLGLEHIESGGPIREYSSIGRAELTSTKFRFDERQVLFGKLRPNLGKIARPDRAGVCSTDILPITPSTRLDRGYLAHYLSQPSMVAFAASRTSGANLPRLSPGVLATFEVPLPEMEEQRRIAAILDKADAIRAKRRQVLAHLDALTQSIFHDMFGSPLSQRVSKRVAIGAVARVVTGNSPSRADPANFGTGIEWVKSDNLGGDRVSQAAEQLSPQGQRKARVAPAGSVLVTCIAGSPLSIGKASLTDRDVAFNQQINAVLPSERLVPEFLLAQLKSAPDLVRRKSTGGMKGLVTKSAFESIEILVPSHEQQQAFMAVQGAVTSQRAMLLIQSQREDQLLRSLQSRAFKGEL